MSTYNPNNSRRRQFERAQYEAKARDSLAGSRIRQRSRFGRYITTGDTVERVVRQMMTSYDEREVGVEKPLTNDHA